MALGETAFPIPSFFRSLLAQSASHARLCLYKYKDMENAKNASQFGGRLAVFCLLSSPASGAN